MLALARGGEEGEENRSKGERNISPLFLFLVKKRSRGRWGGARDRSRTEK